MAIQIAEGIILAVFGLFSISLLAVLGLWFLRALARLPRAIVSAIRYEYPQWKAHPFATTREAWAQTSNRHNSEDW